MRLSEVEGYEGRIFGLVKFTSHIESLRNGTVFMNNLKTYIDMEKETKIKGMGDKLEAAHVYSDVNIKMYTTGTEELIQEGPVGQVSFRHTDDEMTPVYCLFALHKDNLIVVGEDEDYYEVQIDISDNEVEKIISDFGEDLLFINAAPFINKLEHKLKELNYSYKIEIVKYDDYGVNLSERIEAYQENNHNIFFWKDKRFAYQHEYRIVLTSQLTEGGITIEIGNISEFSYAFKAEDFFNQFGLMIKKETTSKN